MSIQGFSPLFIASQTSDLDIRAFASSAHWPRQGNQSFRKNHEIIGKIAASFRRNELPHLAPGNSKVVLRIGVFPDGFKTRKDDMVILGRYKLGVFGSPR